MYRKELHSIHSKLFHASSLPIQTTAHYWSGKLFQSISVTLPFADVKCDSRSVFSE